MFQNIWKHPKTSAAGLLISIVTVVGVLSQQGITLGHAGTGTVVALIGGIATAFLGLLAKDPGSASSAASVASAAGKAVLLALLCITLVFAPIGCTQQQKISVAQAIVNQEPAFQSAIDTAGAVAEMLLTADPGAGLIVKAVVDGANVIGPQLQAAAKSYLANPNQTTLQVLQAVIVQIQNSVNTQLLAAAKITNPSSQQKALVAINGVGTIVNTLLGLVQSISTKAQVAAMSRQVTVHLAQVRPLLDQQSMQLAAVHVSASLGLTRPVSVDQYFAYEASAGF